LKERGGDTAYLSSFWRKDGDRMPCGFQAGKGDCGIWKCVRYGKHVIIKYQTAKEFEFCPFCGSKVGENMYIRFGFG